LRRCYDGRGQNLAILNADFPDRRRPSPISTYVSDGGIVSSRNSFANSRSVTTKPAQLFQLTYLGVRCFAQELTQRPTQLFAQRTTAHPMIRGFSKRRRTSRLGTTAVETALGLPAFLMIAAKNP